MQEVHCLGRPLQPGKGGRPVCPNSKHELGKGSRQDSSEISVPKLSLDDSR